MNDNALNAPLTRIISLLALTLLLITSTALAGQKLTPEEIIAKHLDAIGRTEARKAIKSRVIVGTSTVAFHNPGKGQMSGQAVLASEGNKVLIGMQFDSTNYPFEKLGFDGKNFTAAYLRPGQRSTLGDFLNTNNYLFKQGLIGGALSSAWPLLDPALRHAHLEYKGIRKVNDREAYALEYLSSGGSDLQVTLFFDKESFQHVRTEYEQTIAAQLGANPSGAPDQTQRETHYKMVEEFSDFKIEGGLTLPHTYKITLSVDAQGGTFSADWIAKLTQFDFNQPIDPNSFSVQP